MENIITSKDNPVIKLYQKLSSSKKERVQYGLFVLEGLRITEDAIREESGLSHILITEQAYDKYGEKLFQADLRDTRVIVISNELGNKIASTGTPQSFCYLPHSCAKADDFCRERQIYRPFRTSGSRKCRHDDPHRRCTRTGRSYTLG